MIEQRVKTVPDDLEVANQLIVTIAVQKDTSNPPRYTLTLYPRRGSEVLIYRPTGQAPASPEKPTQVRWAVKGLEPKQKIRIAPKADCPKDVFDDEYTIPYSKKGIVSGRPEKGPNGRDILTWSYRVSLLDGNDAELAFIDPDVEIENDP